jgi:3-methyladenine DNA glycosylase AlkD
MDQLALLRERIRALGSESTVQVNRRFFKTGPGEYSEGDRFLGVSVPQLRALLPGAGLLEAPEVVELLRSPWHEERLFALLLLVRRFQAAPRGGELRDQLVAVYLQNLASVNNWDLVDSSAPHILGEWLVGRDRSILDSLAASGVMWERRVAVVSTQAFIQRGDLEWTFRLVHGLLGDPHDLMHKACGWMLREAYKRDAAPVLEFLELHGSRMPRTMLRYVIERVPEEERKQLLQRYRTGPRDRVACAVGTKRKLKNSAS